MVNDPKNRRKKFITAVREEIYGKVPCSKGNEPLVDCMGLRTIVVGDSVLVDVTELPKRFVKYLITVVEQLGYTPAWSGADHFDW